MGIYHLYMSMITYYSPVWYSNGMMVTLIINTTKRRFKHILFRQFFSIYKFKYSMIGLKA